MRKQSTAETDALLRCLYEAGRTLAEIAAEMGRPRGTIGSRARRLGLVRGPGQKRGSLAARFESFVHYEPNSGCWLWAGHAGARGYGMIGIGGRKMKTATHVSLALAGRAVPTGMFACHRCDMPACVNPDHLFIGTPLDNVRDMIAKGRSRPARGERQRQAKVTAEQVREIRSLAASGTPHRLIAERFGLAPSTVSNINTGHSWKHLCDRDRAQDADRPVPMARQRAAADRGDAQ